MKTITVAFDCDGTLIQNGALAEHQIVANERIRSLLIAMAHMKNVRTVVWSGGGELWARQVGAALGIDKYVDQYADKMLVSRNEAGILVFNPELKPDLAFDDQDCELGTFNIIVREK